MTDPSSEFMPWGIPVIFGAIGIAFVAYAKGYTWQRKQIEEERRAIATEYGARLTQAEAEVQKLMTQMAILQGELDKIQDGIRSARIHFLNALNHIDSSHPAYGSMMELGKALA